MQTEGTHPHYEGSAIPAYGRPAPRHGEADDRQPEALADLSSTSARPKDLSQDAAEIADAGALDQLPFADSVKILSDAMKARVKRQAGRIADDGAPALASEDANRSTRPAGQSLNELLDALKSAMDRAGLEKGNQNALTRIISDIRNSMQYEPQGKGAVQSGPSPNLLDLSA